MEEISFKDFEEKYMRPVKRWDFSKFAIVCKKCGGAKVEYDNTLEVESGWYGDWETTGGLVVKCHDCGNAFTLGGWEMTRK